MNPAKCWRLIPYRYRQFKGIEFCNQPIEGDPDDPDNVGLCAKHLKEMKKW